MNGIDYGQGPAQESQEIIHGDMEGFRPLPRVSIHAFCESEGLLKTIERCGEDRRMGKVNLRANKGSVLAAATMFATSPTPNLIILETTSDRASLFGELEQLASVCDPSTKVVIIGHNNDVGLYRELIRNGISEYMVAPVSMADLIGTITGIFVDPDSEPLGRTIAFVGAKGGVGSSTIAHNCAWAVSNLFATEVILADLDLAFGTANINFDQDPAQGIAEAVFSPERIDEVYLDRLLAQCAERLSLLAAPSTLDRVYDFDADAFASLIETAQRSAPTVILDVPHVWTGWTRQTLAQADEIVVTATPELANLRNTKNLIDMLRKLRPNDAPPKLILNQAGVPKRPEISADDFAEPLGVVPLAVIPFEPLLFGNAANNGRMLGETDAQHAIVKIVHDMAHVLTGRTEMKSKKKAGIGDLLGRLKMKKKSA
jgi:pilus assembly protein CpaE